MQRGWVCCIPTRGGDGVDEVVDVVVRSVAEAAALTVVVEPAVVTATVRFVVVVASVALGACECVRLEGWGWVSSFMAAPATWHV